MSAWSPGLLRGLAQPELLAALARRGFVAIAPRSDALAEYRHPDTGPHVYTVWQREWSYTRALDRLERELAAMRAQRHVA